MELPPFPQSSSGSQGPRLIDDDPVSRSLIRGHSLGPLQPVWVNTTDIRTPGQSPPKNKKKTGLHPPSKAFSHPFNPPVSDPHLVSLTCQSSPLLPPSCNRAGMLSAHQSVLVSRERPGRWEPRPPNGSLEKEERLGQQVP